MRLNPDCIRDILLTVEENTGFSKLMGYPADTEYERLKSYSTDEVSYHINQCELSYLFTEVTWLSGGSCLIHDLSPKGHEFIANIRSDNIWNKTKETAKDIGSSSLNALTQIAVNIVSSLIQ